MTLCLKPHRFSVASWTPPKGQGAREEGADHFLRLPGATWLVRHLEEWTQPLPCIAYSPSSAPAPLLLALFQPRVWLCCTYSFSGHSRIQWTPFSRNLWNLSQAKRETNEWPRAEEVRGPLGHSPKPLPPLQPFCHASTRSSAGRGPAYRERRQPHPKKPESCRFWLLSRTLGGMSAPAPMILAQPLAYPPISQQASAFSWELL